MATLRNTVLIVLFTTLISTAFSQAGEFNTTVELSDTIKAKDFWWQRYETHQLNNEKTVKFGHDKSDPWEKHLILYDHQNKKTLDTTFNAKAPEKSSKIYIIDELKIGDDFVLLHRVYNKKTKWATFYAQRIVSEAGTFSDMIEIGKRKPLYRNKKEKINVAQSKSKNNLFLGYFGSQYGAYIYTASAYNEELKEQSTVTINMEENENVVQPVINEHMDMAFIVEELENSSGERKYNRVVYGEPYVPAVAYKLVVYRKGSDTAATYPLGEYINEWNGDFKLVFNDNRQIILTGYDSKKGIILITENLDSKELSEPIIIEPDEFDLEKISYKNFEEGDDNHPKPASIKTFLSDVIIFNEGLYVITQQVQKGFVLSSSPSAISPTGSNTSVGYHSYHGNIVVYKVSFSGNLEWNVQIPRYNYYSGYFTIYNYLKSFSYKIKGNDLYIVNLDCVKNQEEEASEILEANIGNSGAVIAINKISPDGTRRVGYIDEDMDALKYTNLFYSSKDVKNDFVLYLDFGDRNGIQMRYLNILD